MQILLNLLIEYGYYSEVIELVKYLLERKPKQNNILELTTMGVSWAEALIVIDEPVKALNLIRTLFPYLQDKESENPFTKLSTKIETTEEFQKILDSCIKDSLKSLELEKSSYDRQLHQLKCIVSGLKGLHKLNQSELESEFFSYIQDLIEEKKDARLQMIEWFDLSRYFREKKEYKREFEFLIKAQSTESYAKTPLLISNDPFEIRSNPTLEIPNMIDERIQVINKFGAKLDILSDLERINKIWKFIKLGLDGQAMGSHDHAIAIGLEAIKLLNPSDPDQIKKQIYEILIFSHLYLNQWLDAQTYIDLATPFDKDPLYYQIYAVIVKLGLKKYPDPQRLLFSLWKLMQMRLKKHESFLNTFSAGLLHLAEY